MIQTAETGRISLPQQLTLTSRHGHTLSICSKFSSVDLRMLESLPFKNDHWVVFINLDNFYFIITYSD